ncbi:hypothetical protein CHS0354_034270 [Potamilus streckersoni]|uniref:Uncharacterized protein n=1 Tax=Potamilus streckersoni TaxID=2493646 RepID=A0AAE0S4C2_9BIVA|nr:hypothetical protein CHS0354_034270 [Potamilus streckersoni]
MPCTTVTDCFPMPTTSVTDAFLCQAPLLHIAFLCQLPVTDCFSTPSTTVTDLLLYAKFCCHRILSLTLIVMVDRGDGQFCIYITRCNIINIYLKRFSGFR